MQQIQIFVYTCLIETSWFNTLLFSFYSPPFSSICHYSVQPSPPFGWQSWYHCWLPDRIPNGLLKSAQRTRHLKWGALLRSAKHWHKNKTNCNQILLNCIVHKAHWFFLGTIFSYCFFLLHSWNIDNYMISFKIKFFE